MRDEAAEIDVLVRRLTFERVLMDIASRAPRSSTSISSTLLEGCSAESWFNMVLGDGVAEKQSNGVGGVEIAASVHVRAQTEQVGIKHLEHSKLDGHFRQVWHVPCERGLELRVRLCSVRDG